MRPESRTYRANCFLSLPHESHHLRKALEQVVKGLGGRAVYVTEPEGQRLRQEIKSGLASSAVLIADLSSPPNGTAGPRPAIMWEIGYAEASGMNAIYLCQKKDKSENVPSIIAEEHLVEYELHRLDEALKSVESALEKIVAREATSGTTVFRANSYVDRRSCDLEVKYLDARNTIRILELNLDTVQTQAPTIIRALSRSRDLSVQLLTLDPFSDFAAARADQLGELPLPYRRMLFDAMKHTHEELGKIDSERWELRVYDTFPTQIMFEIDDAIFHSIISLGRKSRDMLHFEVQRTQPNSETSFEAHFRTLWNRSTDYQRWLHQNQKSVEQLLGIHRAPDAVSSPRSRKAKPPTNQALGAD